MTKLECKLACKRLLLQLYNQQFDLKSFEDAFSVLKCRDDSVDQFEVLTLLSNLAKLQEIWPLSAASMHRRASTDNVRESRTITDNLKLKLVA